MSTEAAVADVATAEHDNFQQAGEDLTAAFAAAGVNTETVPEKKEVEPEKKKSDVTENKGIEELPDELLTGIKPEDKKKENADDILSQEPPERLSKEGKVNWNKLRDRANHHLNENATLKNLVAELESRKPSGPDETTATELKTLRDRAKELEGVVEKSHFEKSPRFQKFLNREKQQIEGAQKYLEGSTIDPNIIELAAKASGKKRIDILKDAGADPEIIAAITPYLAQYDSIQQDKAYALENHKQIIEQDSVNQRRDAESKAAHERENEEKVFKSVGEQVSKTFEPFQKVAGNEKWNAQVDRLNGEAKEFFSGDMPLEKVAEIAYMGVGAKVIHEMNHRLRERLKSVIEENTALKAAQPTADGADPNNVVTDPADESYLDGAGRRFNQALRG